jgi:hypothetical protein
MGWPLPKIKEILYRLGASKAKYWAILDLTSGYHQAPIAKDSQKYTAFICFMGVFQWKRLPMGIMPAGSFFQAMMAAIFVGMIYMFLEIYLDDMIVHGRTFSEYLQNLRKVFTQARERNLTFNPKKCKFLMKEFEGLGHVIDSEGIQMSSEKIGKVLDFPFPVQMVHLKSFIGLANYFRDHIPDMSLMTQPLNAMCVDYKKSKHKVIKWTEESKKAFGEVQEAIGKCQKLFFLDEVSPIFVLSDSSKYGIGGYLVQIIEGVEMPIAFMSKSFDKTQQRWPVIEQECFAFFYAITSWEYLLQGRRFTLRTDHRNLTFLNESASEKVRRWKLALQHYSFDIQHIQGRYNKVSDDFSRLVADVTKEDMKSTAQRPAEHANPTKTTEQQALNASQRIPLLLVGTRCRPFEKDKQQTTLGLLRKAQPLTQTVYDQIAACHCGAVGHHGLKRTRILLQQAGKKWPQMAAHIRQFISLCTFCQKESFRVPLNGTTRFTVSSDRPMVHRAIDTIGPLP